MRANFEIDEGHKNLKGISEFVNTTDLSEASEADTRCKIIDSILRSVLGWSEEDILREERISEDRKVRWADYILSTATLRLLIEAKAAGKDFTLPNNRMSGKLGGFLSQGLVGESIRQARDYARSESIQFAVVTNGMAWIIFPVFRTDGVKFESSSAKIFRSFDDLRERFVEFWELLSRQRVLDGNLETELLGGSQEGFSSRLQSLLPEPGYRLGRNAIYDHIEPAVSSALSDEALLSSPLALKSCYIKGSERVKFDKRLRMYLADIKPPLERKIERVKDRSGKTAIERRLEEGATASPRFILLLGAVGAGKTTFLFHTRLVSGKNLIDDKVLWLYIDFKKATSSDSVREFIYSEVLSIVEEDAEFKLGDWEHSIRPAYREEIDKLERGVLRPLKLSDPKQFEIRISEQIQEDRQKLIPYVDRILKRSARLRPGYIVLDNVDQILNPTFQNEVFSEAQALAQKLGINVIISLREATFLRHRTQPAFDAFQFETLYIDPPSVLPVISRRFSFAKHLLSGKKGDISLESGVKIHVPDLSVFFDIVKESILSEQSGFLLDVLAGGDIRRGLQYVREFLASGHTSADKALHVYLTEGRYNFPPHEVFKGAVLGQRAFFREEESLLLNILDSKLRRKGTELARLHILTSLVEKAKESSFEGVAGCWLRDELYRLGISHFESERLLRDLLNARLIRTTHGFEFDFDALFVPTRLAGYMVQELSSQFTYLEMCVLDAYILDESIWENLAEQTESISEPASNIEKIAIRLRRVETFLDYLVGLEDTWSVECRRRKVDDELIRQPLRNIIRRNFVQSEKDRVLRSARRQKKSRGKKR